MLFHWYQSYHWYQWTIGITLYPARSHGKIIKVPLMRCIFTDRTIGMTSFSIGTKPTIGTNGPSVWRIVSVCVYWTCVVTSYPVDSANTFWTTRARSKKWKLLSAQGFKANLSARFFFSIGGQCSCFYKSFSCDGGGGEGGPVRVEGGLSLFTCCFLNGPKKWS